MNTINLNGEWQLGFRPEGVSGAEWRTVNAEVPGNVECDLMRHGIIPDLTKGDNIYRALELEGYEWRYEKAFQMPEDFPVGGARLVFEGIDCLATVLLNGQEIGQAANMFIEHVFDAGPALNRGGSNYLEVRIRSAVREGLKHEVGPDTLALNSNWEALRIRKAGHMYGWDIAPRIVSAGLWRGVRLEAVPETEFRSVYLGTISVDTVAATAKVLVDWDIVSEHNLHDLTLALTVNDGAQTVYQVEKPVLCPHGRLYVDLKDVKFWWPLGYGAAHLYDVSLQIRDKQDMVLTECRQKLGVRTIKLQRTPLTSEAHDGDFSFIVNGQRIYVKGTNWVPLDALHARDKQHLESTMAMAVDLNCNMLRCWGGNVYEDHDFFALCDLCGIMVWQDFALACACYPQDEEFMAQIRREATSVVKKLRNHPSLALWSGNNEIDCAYAEWSQARRDPNVCDKISRVLLAEVVSQLDYLRDYLPSSPYYSPELMSRGIPHTMKPEDHLWGPRDDFKGKFYMSSNAHFVSEIGYHGCPDPASMREMFDADKLWPWENNDQWLTRAVRPLPRHTDYNYRIPLMASQIEVLFDRRPENLEDFILASQVSQAEALKFFIEKWRSEKGFRGGMLWWNLRDCWPLISDAIVDYYDRKKLAYEYVKASQRDVCFLVTEPENGKHKLMVVNDLPCAVNGAVVMRDADSGALLYEGCFTVAENGQTALAEVAVSAKPAMWLLEMTIKGKDSVQKNHYLAGPRPFQLEVYRKWLKKIRG